MGKRFVCASLLLLAAFAPARAQAPANANARAVLTLADAPLRLIRGAAVYKAPNGVALQADDILESGAGGAQVEAGPDAIVALGPRTRVLLAGLPADGRGPLEVTLLEGWVNVLGQHGRARVSTPVLRVSLGTNGAGGSTIVRAGAGQDAVFAEDGEQQLARLTPPDAKGKAPLKLAAEQYAAFAPDKPQPALGRPPREFVAAMPPAFRDRLTRAPAVPGAGKVAPVKERDTDFADVDAWLRAPLPDRNAFVARFKPRLADPAFRKALDAALGQSPEWKPVLHPVRTIQDQSGGKS